MPNTRPLINAHIHLPPNFSAFETTAQAVELAAAQDVRVLGVSNYYDYSVYAEFSSLAEQHGIFPLFGLEVITLIDSLVRDDVKINDPGNPGKMYLCGKGITRFDPMPETARQLFQVIRDNDSTRMAAVTDKLAAVFSDAGLETGLNAEAVKGHIVARHGSLPETVYLQERHVAQAFQEILFDHVSPPDRAKLLQRAFGAPSKAEPSDAVTIQNEIRSHLLKSGKPAYVAETFVDFDHAYRLILALGGIPCYPDAGRRRRPHYRRMSSPLNTSLPTFKRGASPAPSLFRSATPPKPSRAMSVPCAAAGLFVTAGTEHNTLDLLPLAPACLNGEPIPDDIQEIFWEGACVLAAHQSPHPERPTRLCRRRRQTQPGLPNRRRPD